MFQSGLRSIVIRVLLLGFVAVSVTTFQNCAKANFSSGEDPVAAAGTPSQGTPTLGVIRAHIDQPNTSSGSCYTVLHEQTVPVKVLFVVDVSGSNAGLKGTDPDRSVRSGSIQAFFNDLGTKPNFNWGFVTFSSSSATALIANGVTAIFSSLSSDMQNAISAFKVIPDQGETPYRAALAKAVEAVSGDNGSVDTKYIVVFISDGMPNPDVADSILADDVRSVLAAKPGRVTFNTIYYGPTNLTASQRLYNMAQVGKGNFLDTNANPSGKSFLISNIVVTPGQVCTP